MNEIPFKWTINAEEKIINLNTWPLENKIEQWQNYLDNTKEAFKIEKTPAGRLKTFIVSKEAIQFLNQWLQLIANSISSSVSPCDLDILVEIVRALRNSSSNPQTQSFIIENTNILNIVSTLFDNIINIDSQHLSLKLLLQFLHNLITSNKDAVHRTHSQMNGIIHKCLEKHVYGFECSALLYQIFINLPFYNLIIFQRVIDIFKTDSNEFLYFLLENCFQYEEFWLSVFKNLYVDQRIVLLEFMKHLQIKKGNLKIHEIGLDILIKSFLESSDIIFQTKIREGNNTHIQEVSLTLEIISSSSGNACYSRIFLNKDLLINAGVVLINIHKLGKDSDNCFTPIQKLSEFRDGNEKINKHPAFGFKADLIRLIGNICCKNTEMQNLARNAELIPAILDCCNMDALNPFIIQWSILAVKNLCENNLENQKIIASLHKQGVVSNETLREMGVNLHSDGKNQLNIVPLDVFSKQ